MSYDYDAFYAENPHGLGDATKDVIAAFDGLDTDLTVLDIGCGQGRDALPLARRGHRVHAVDLSAAGIAQLSQDAAAEALPITAEVADIVEFVPPQAFDVILIDRTLHMLPAVDQRAVLQRLLGYVRPEGYVFIADERSNLPAFRAAFAEDAGAWQVLKDKGQYLFAQLRPSEGQ